MSEWITNRAPTSKDADNGYVWVTIDGVVLRQAWECVHIGRPWQPIVPPKPYVKPKRYEVHWFIECERVVYYVYDVISKKDVVKYIPTREAAMRIAAIYEEVMP